MPSKLGHGPVHLNENMIVSLDIRVGGHQAETSDLLEIAILPVNHSYKLHERYKMFQIKIRPSWKVDKRVAKLNATNIEEYTGSAYDSVAAFALFERWYKSLDMKEGKKLAPLVWNWGDIKPRLVNWMGEESFDHYFMDSVRDGLGVLNWLNDRTHVWGEDQEFKGPTFAQFMTHTGTKLIDSNNIAANAMGLLEAYRKTLGTYVPGFKGPTSS